MPLLAALLSLPVPDRYPPLTLSPQRQKQQTQEALVAWLLAETVQQPVLAVWEDLHWADPSTLELLGLLLDQVPTTRLLMVLTCRPEFRPPWAPRSYVTPLTLSRLTRQQIEEMVLRVTGGKALPAEVVQQIVAKTDGIPLFVEELVKTILDAGLVREEAARYVLTGPLPPLAIPATLQDALMARLDRLAPVKEVAQLGAVLGREFAYALLRAVAPMDEPTLQHGLAQLVEAELLYQRGILPQATYLFKHALVQDAAYQSLLRSTRQQYHARIAHVLEAQFPETATTQPELLAHHYTEAGLTAQAMPYWQQAGQRALERSANLEAVAHLTKGLEVLATLPDTPERAQQELDDAAHPGPGVNHHQGPGEPGSVTSLCPGARALPAGGRDPAALPGAAGLVVLLPASDGVTDGAGAGGAAPHPGPAGRRPGASPGGPLCPREHLELSGRVYRGPGPFGAGHRPLRSSAAPCPCLPLREGPRGGVPILCQRDPVVSGLSRPGLTEEPRGPDASPGAGAPLQPGKRPILCSVGPSVPPRVAPDPGAGRGSHSPRGRAGVCGLGSGGTILRGWALAQRYAELGAGQGQREEGMAQMQQGLAAWRATGAAVFRPYGLALLAEAYAQVGRCEEGLTLLAEALAVTNDKGERRWEAELYRLKGELLLARSAAHDAEAETCFRQALDVARHQQAKSWELRAAMSLEPPVAAAGQAY